MTNGAEWTIIKTQGDARANRHLPVVETQTVAATYNVQAENVISNRESSVGADGSLLFIVQIQHERHDAGNGAKGSKDSQQCRSHMYILPPSERFPARAVYTPPFRSRGMTGNRLLPHTVYKGGKNSTRTVGFHLALLYRFLSLCQTDSRNKTKFQPGAFRAGLMFYTYFTGLEDLNVTSW